MLSDRCSVRGLLFSCSGSRDDISTLIKREIQNKGPCMEVQIIMTVLEVIHKKRQPLEAKITLPN